MNKNVTQQPISVANSSGFPLQLGISNVVNLSSKWELLLEEHPWCFEETGSEGFIDLVVINRQSKFETLVIECKRVRQSAWVFLLPKSPSKQRSQVTVFGSQIEDTKWKHFDWEDWQADPVTYQSQFCCIPGQEQGRKNLLERTASELAYSAEALANQERKLEISKSSHNFSRVYIPVLVTTAKLTIAEFNPEVINLNEGNLPEDTQFQEVPFIRFRKSLATNIDTNSPQTIGEFYAASERTIFVVNAESFSSFIEQYEFRDI